jgi:hypothetical protein
MKRRVIKYELNTHKRLTFTVSIPSEIKNPDFRLKIFEDKKCIYSESCQRIGNKVIGTIHLNDYEKDKSYFLELQRFRDDQIANDIILNERLEIIDSSPAQFSEYVKRGSTRKRDRTTDLVAEYKRAKLINESKKSKDDVLLEYDKTLQVWKRFFEEISVSSVGAAGSHLSGQTRAVGKKDGIITRLSPSASRPQPVTDSDDLFIQGIDFLSYINFDLLADEQELEVYSLLDDFLFFSEYIEESGFRKRVPGSKRVALRRYQRQHKQRIKNNLKKRERTIKGIIDTKKRKKMEKFGQTKDNRRMRKNHVAGGKSRRTK